MDRNFAKAERRYLNPDSGADTVPMWKYYMLKSATKGEADRKGKQQVLHKEVCND